MWQLKQKLKLLVIPSIDGLATEIFVTDAIGAIPAQDLSSYETIVANDAKLALKADKTELDGLATETFVTDAIGAIPATDLTGHETIVANDAKLALKADKTEVAAVDSKVDALVIPSIDGLATETFVTDAIDAIPEVDLTGHETIVANDVKLALKADKTELDGLATETFVTDAIDAIPVTDLSSVENAITAIDSKVDALVIPSIEGLATETFVTDAIAAIPTTDLSVFETIASNDVKLALKADKTEVSSAVNTAVSNLVNGAPETFNTLKEIADWIEGDGVNTTELTNAIANKADRSEVDAVDAKVDALVIPSITGLATEIFVTDAIANIDIPSITGLATETYVDDAIANKAGRIEDAIANKADRSEVDAVDAKVEALVIPSINGLATKTYVDDVIAVLEIDKVSESTMAKLAPSTITIDKATLNITYPDVVIGGIVYVEGNTSTVYMKINSTEWMAIPCVFIDIMIKRE